MRLHDIRRYSRAACWRISKARAYAARLPARAGIEMLKRTARLPPVSFEELLAGYSVSLPPLIVEHCCLPPYQGPIDHNDMTPLLQITAVSRPAVILELGTAYGNTVANLANVSNARIFTVNALPEQISGDLITFALRQEDIGSVYRERHLQDRVTQIYENTLSLDLSRYLIGPVVDLAIIDACHDTEFVMSDFLVVAPFIREGGIVLLHDTHPSMRGHLAGSYIACMQLRRQGFDVRHISGTWWGIWTRPGMEDFQHGNYRLPALRKEGTGASGSR